ncbi:hypothetical protein VTI28DRAFT_4587 [Corynascus sepedonium]
MLPPFPSGSRQRTNLTTRHTTWCFNQGNNYRGQRFRSRYRHCLGQDRLGSLRSDHKQPGERWLPERCSSGIMVGSVGMSLRAGSQDWKCWLAWERRPVLKMADVRLYKSVNFGAMPVFCRFNLT